MATLSATLIWGGLRHPLRSLQTQFSRHAPISAEQSSGETAVATDRAQSPEQLERIAAYACCGYFHMEYTAGMFVVPLKIPPD